MSDVDNSKLRRLDGGLLLVFRELLRVRRSSLVAERLGLSPPAISHALTRLRELFDDQLFIRRPHGFEPTRRALELGPRIEALIELAGAAMTPEPGFDPASSRRRFTIAAPEFVTALIGGALINQLRAVAPGVSFVVAHIPEADAYKALDRGGVDLALGRFGAARPGYLIEPFLEDVYCVVARDGHPGIDGAIDEAGWRNIGHVFAWHGSETGEPRARSGGDVAQLAVVPQWLTALMLVAETDGIATCPRRLAERHAGRLGLQVLEPPFTPDTIRVSVLRRKGARDLGVEWFLGQVRQAAGG
jgi:DNA-binding transcriptional LysR family regulator